jgi:hypothetical protein
MDRRAMVGGMSASCGHSHPPPTQPGLRRVLWLALAGNASMFALELASGLQAQSLALWADAIDFFADAMAYAITLAVLGSSLRARLRAARFKALVMAALGLWVLGRALWQAGDRRGAAARPDHGRGGTAGAGRQPRRGLAALPLPRGRREPEVGVAVLAQRRHRQPGGDGGRGWGCSAAAAPGPICWWRR